MKMNANAMGGCEERDTVVCPKPRRVGLFNNPSLRDDHIRPFRWPSNCHQAEMVDSKVGTELLDIIFAKGGSNQVASSPPYFCGSPPIRASNPLIQDVQFNKEKQPAPLFPGPLSPSSRLGGGGCVRMKFGQKPAAVRIEGFDCLSRDGRNCSISAMA